MSDVLLPQIHQICVNILVSISLIKIKRNSKEIIDDFDCSKRQFDKSSFSIIFEKMLYTLEFITFFCFHFRLRLRSVAVNLKS